MNLAIRMVLGIIQMPEQTVNDLDKHLPGFEELAGLIKQAEPIIQRNLPHLAAIQPDLPALIDLAKKAWPIFVDVTPTTGELIDFVKKD